MRVPQVVEREGWILYDDSCGLCRRWVPLWETTLRERGFGIAPLQSDWVRQRLGSEGLLDDLMLLSRMDGLFEEPTCIGSR
jgi:predicted DCC family thiol-disulfide oxidoreductase YuxK